jgi:hypothetical protein
VSPGVAGRWELVDRRQRTDRLAVQDGGLL